MDVTGITTAARQATALSILAAVTPGLWIPDAGHSNLDYSEEMGGTPCRQRYVVGAAWRLRYVTARRGGDNASNDRQA